MRGFAEIRQRIAEGSRVGGLEQHKGHARSEKDYVRPVAFHEVFMLEIPIVSFLVQPLLDHRRRQKKETGRITLPKTR